MSVKIGLLLPNSNYFPGFSKDIRAALKMGLDASGNLPYELVIEPTQYNAKSAFLTTKTQDLLVKHEVDVVVAPLNPGVFATLTPLFSGQEVPLVALTMGEDTTSLSMRSPYLFVNSFGAWQAAWMMGHWGGQQLGKRAANAAAYHDGGYGMLFASAIGLEAQGGEIRQTAITHINSRMENPAAQIGQLLEHDPDFLMGIYAGQEAHSFVETYVEMGSSTSQLLGLAQMMDAQLLDRLGDQLVGAYSFAGVNHQTAAFDDLATQFSDQTGHRMHGYALLAYEVGLLVAAAAQQVTGKVTGLRLVEGLHSAEIVSPRGTVTFEAESQEVATACYLRRVALNRDGKAHHEVVEQLTVPEIFYEQQALARKNVAKQGWLNPYLIA